MKITLLGSAIALAAMSITTPIAAQPAPGGWQNNGGGWDRDAFWRGAPTSIRERVDFLQRRIDRGVADGSLDRREARRSQGELDGIRRDAMRMRGNGDPRANDSLQRRLDDLASRVRWQRRDGDQGYNGRPGGPGGPGYNAGAGYNGGPRGDDRQYVTDYDASRDYRDDPRYQERRLSANDQVYRGSDNRYYCKRSDGTTGLIIGAVGGGILGNVIDGGHQRAAGTLLGGALGALAGKSIDQNSDVRCR